MEFESIQEIFNKSFDMTEWKGVLKRLFSNFDEYRSTIDRLEPNLTYHEKAKEINEFGSILLADNKVIKLYDVLLKGDYDVAKSRVGLRNMIFRDIVPGDMDGILAVYRSENGKTWRLTFISKAIYWDDDFNEQKLQTSPRRYTYVLGEDESVKTAAKQFESLFNKKVTIKQLIEAFNVDKLNKRFFSDYQKHYEKFVLELTGEVWKKKQNKYVLTKIQEPSPLLKTAFYNNKKHARDFCKKLLGRIVFLHFLQKKGWMGCAIDDKHWENGEKQFMLELFNGFEDKTHFHSKCLTELFFNTLNKPNRNDIFEVEGLSNHLNGSKVPYLNGGLFETDTNCDPYKVDFPPVFFEELLDFFGQYNFTIDENSPDDHEVGIDPEMLGHIFENLLEENKEKGAFYTPKEIVQYMTQESLIQYLQTHLGEHEELSNFIRNNDIGDRTAKHNYIRDNAAHIEELLDNVKICDPAIGSGAFPMGMLNEIFEAKMALDMTLNRSEVKKKIIQNSIYGVDLESGAVDIARLRFWLALVVDEDEPHALPNLDYKIMQGNSLLESFEGIDLSEIHKGKAITIDDENSGDNLFSKVMEVQEVYNEEKLEDLIKTYFDLDSPVEKKEQHDKIDKQILGKIYKCLFDEHEELEDELKKLNRKIKNKSASLSTAEQKIKYENASKDAKNAKKLRDQIDSIAQKQLKLKELYESDDRPFFLWHLMFQDVFEKGGFDIVIGNPPYVKIQNIESDLSTVYKSKFSSATGKYDLYVLFIELSFSLIKPSGNIIYINPHRFIIADYGKGLKELIIKRKWLNKLLYFGVDQIFENATTYSGIFLFKQESSHIDYCKPKSRNLKDLQFTNIPYDLVESSWLLTEDKTTIKILSRINEFKGLSHYCEGINQGIITTGDKIFMLQGEINGDVFTGFSEELGENVSIEAKALKPVLKGEDIQRYSPISTNRYVIYLHHLKDDKTLPYEENYVKEEFPKTYEYLENFKKELVKKKIKYKTNPKYWYSLHRSRELNILEKPNKILTPQLQNKSSFTFDNEGLFIPDAGGYIVALKKEFKALSKALLGILNSKLFYFFITKTSTPYNNNYYYFKTNYILPFKLPNLSSDQQAIIGLLTEAIILLKKQEEDKFHAISITFEEIIDALVLELYFSQEFKEESISILEHSKTELQTMLELNDRLDLEVLLNIHKSLQEKKNPLRNQIKLMKLELKHLLLPILSV